MIRCYVRSEVPYMAAATRLYRCRKCRERVFDSQCVVTVHGQQNTLSDGSAVLPSVSCQDVSMETVWYVTVDSAPEWILNNIETAMWTKGKLLCPKCEGRLGSFDFTKTVKCACGKFTVPPIHILQCRIDQVSTASATQEILRRRQKIRTLSDEGVATNTEGYSESGPSLNALPVYQGHQDVSDDGCPSNAEQPERLTLSRRDLLGDEHRHPDAPRRSKQRSGRKRGITKADTSPADHDQNNDVDPVYPEEHTCPVCLDLYCYPMRTSPCDHVFCDPCLRRLARATPVNTPCPLCRRVIAKCHGEDDLAGDLKTWYSALYKKRQVMENKFRKDSYHKLPQLNPATLRLPNMDRLGQDPWQPFDRARNLYNRMGVNLPYVLHSVVFIAVMVCNTVYRFSVELASLPLSTALVVTGLVFIALLAVSGLLAISHVVRVVGSVSQVLGQAIVEFMGSVFLLPRVESFKSESSQSLLPTSVRIRAMTANFFLVVIVVIICRYVFFRRVNVQLGRNV